MVAVNLALSSDITPRVKARSRIDFDDDVVVNDALDEDANSRRLVLIRESYVRLLPRDAHCERSAHDLVSLGD